MFGHAWERPHGRVLWAGTGAWLIAWQVQPGRKSSKKNFALGCKEGEVSKGRDGR